LNSSQINLKISLSELKSPVNLLALGFGSGLAPKAPGTFGTLLAFILAIFFPIFIAGWWIVFSSLLGIYLCHQCAKNLKIHDHPAIVWDEFCGLWLTLFLTQNMAFYAQYHWMTFVASFVLFRIFDIVKPWPISFLDKKVAGGLGIMVDDLVAALFAAICLYGFSLFFA